MICSTEVYKQDSGIKGKSMSRCKACNKVLQDYENLSKNPKSGQHEELCRICINAGYSLTVGPEVSIMDVPLLDSLPGGPKSYDD